MADLLRLLAPLLFLVFVAAGDDYICLRGCPPFWTSFGRSCYRYFGQPRTWVEAEELCSTFAGSRGLGHLVSIVSDDENSFIVQMVTGIRTPATSLSEACAAHRDTLQADAAVKDTVSGVTAKTSLTWLGITDLKKEGVLSWTDGTKVVYTSWNDGLNLENTENRDTREYKGRKHEKGEDRDEKHNDQSTANTEGNTCGYLQVPGTGRTWAKSGCNDTTAVSPYVCRIVWT